MPDLSAENPVQPEQKKPSIAERVKGRLAEFWQRVGPERVYQENIKTLQEMHDVMGPGKAQEVFKRLEGPLKAVSLVTGVATSVVDVSLGALANSFYRRLAAPFVASVGLVGGLPGRAMGNRAVEAVGILGGLAAGEAIRTVSGVGIGAGVSELGVAQKTMNIAQRATRPLQVRIAEAVGNITRGWGQKTEPAPKPAAA